MEEMFVGFVGGVLGSIFMWLFACLLLYMYERRDKE